MNVELLESSFAQISPHAIAFSASFYEKLFQKNPQLKPLFDEVSQQAQEKKLVFSLAAIVENLRNPEILQPALKSLGARHFQVGTLKAHYPMVGEALLETFAQYMGADWTPAVSSAWLEAYEAIATVMMQGAQRPQDYLHPELTFYEWIDLYGEESPQVRDAIATLTEYHYGHRSAGSAQTQPK